ncbi:hypothetical protein BWI96_05965 [Siphonobacter sp. SORGH_AS_0500]|uniref:hypothetical protein n=1 Tax=Siphonobacter sp. SORGH_AS_0500 TaxID=1864824 RepID=UPI000CACA183|nr:hypothetical protein [Siphonobacter sp. SORGH_AS_0500]PKK37413.1 hypothetical protein BWI96_05965 [Siphonobacter sp. SORGH_AS_0500]
MNLQTWTLIISTLSDLSDGLPFALFLSFYKYSSLRIYFGGAFIIKLLTIVMIFGFGSRNTHPFYHVLALFEFSCLFLFYAGQLQWSRWQTFLPLVSILLLDVGFSLFLQNIFTFNSYAWSINTLILLIVSIRYLYYLYEKVEDVPLEEVEGFIINSGFLIYFAGSLFTYLLGFNILSGQATGWFGNGWLFQSVANLIKNLVISYGLRQFNSNR